jgi:hypothetical protein
MSIFGKVLLVINLLLMGGFAYLAVQDWHGRQTIAAAGLRHQLLLVGLPLGDRPGDPRAMPSDPDAEIPFRVELAGDVPTETVSPALLKNYLAAAGGPAEEAAAKGVVVGTYDNKPVTVLVPPSLGGNQPVPNQLAEVDRVLKEVKSQVEQADGANVKAGYLGAWLILQPETYDERSEVLKLIQDRNVGELEKRLYGRFEQVLSAPRNPDVAAVAPTDNPTAEDLKARRTKAEELLSSGVKDEPERRARLAHLLVHLDPSAAWQKRVMMIIGLRQYVRTIAEQTLRFSQMTARVQKQIADDQEQFVAANTQLRNLAIQRTQLVRNTEETRNRVATQNQKDKDFVKQREVQLAELKDELTRIKQEVNELLARQKITEAALFAIQREVGLTLEDIYKLEDDLRRIERERYGMK